ncbi:MAG: PIN domain nuclease of toxin-antitoxin system, partial [Yoonia sp.]
MAGLVLDSYALIAYFRDEDGADTVETLLVKATQSGKPLLMSE